MKNLILILMKKSFIFLFIVAATACNERMKNDNLTAPPLGWNSWTSYGWMVSEKDILVTADVMAEKLKPYGYEFLVLDGGWHVSGSPGDTLDQYGMIPSKSRFPHGIPWLAKQVHDRKLKFGIHIMRGVSRDGYKRNDKIFGTDYRIRDIADTTSVCGWSDQNYGIDMNKPGSQEYYDFYIGEVVSWGVDFIKIDDITEHPAEILAVKKAIDKTRKKVILSLSPGDNAKVSYLQAYNVADMVRVTPDIWDNQKGIDQAFAAWKIWSEVFDRHFWIDMDMIPFGHLSLSNPFPDYLLPGENQEGGEGVRERMSFLSTDQKYTFITLRALSASPLMMGGALPTSDEFSFELLTNKEMLACNQNGVTGKLIYSKDSMEIWKTPDKNKPNKGWIGIFNRTAHAKSIQLSLSDLGIKNTISLYDIWQKKELGTFTSTSKLTFQVSPNGVVFCRIK